MDINELYQWLVGLLVVSVLIGYFLSYFWYWLLCKLRKIAPAFPLCIKPKSILRWWADGQTGSLMGIIERVFFTILIALNISGVATAMVTWAMFKNSTLWAGFREAKLKEPGRLFVSMMSSVGSMLIAVLGAYICNGKIHF